MEEKEREIHLKFLNHLVLSTFANTRTAAAELKTYFGPYRAGYVLQKELVSSETCYSESQKMARYNISFGWKQYIIV